MSDAAGGQVLMWEAQAVAGRVQELIEAVLAAADPTAQVYRSADDRVVVIDPSGRGVPEVPAQLTNRPAHQWAFVQVR